MKNYNFLKNKIDDMLMKRYAFNYLFSIENKFNLILLSSINFILFCIIFAKRFYVIKSNLLLTFLTMSIFTIIILNLIVCIIKRINNRRKKKINLSKNSFWHLSFSVILSTIFLILGYLGVLKSIYVTIIIFFILSSYIIFKTIYYIPKFIWIGVLGWILLTAEVIPGMLAYNFQGNSYNETDNALVTNKQDSRGMDFSKFLGNKIVFDNIKNKTEFQDFAVKAYRSLFTLNNYFTIWLGLTILLIFIYFLTFYSGSARTYRLRKYLTFFLIIIMVGFGLILFIHSNIYFIPLTIALFAINTAIVYWEMYQRGRNIETFTRAVNFIFVTQLITANIGEAIYIASYPVFASQINIKDFVTFIWIIITGSGLATLMALITQLIWSGRRLTQKNIKN